MDDLEEVRILNRRREAILAMIDHYAFRKLGMCRFRCSITIQLLELLRWVNDLSMALIEQYHRISLDHYMMIMTEITLQVDTTSGHFFLGRCYIYYAFYPLKIPSELFTGDSNDSVIVVKNYRFRNGVAAQKMCEDMAQLQQEEESTVIAIFAVLGIQDNHYIATRRRRRL
ncbi:hypothetical protein T08_14554 [Trichinella sp. T8]|nr:hypothetical protein T08_14554 [Trichinella sp. T8]